eukprot:TRINITY_DN17621_c0_g1_i1.p1 TRINITY_DN17621_c0_g1~~TRINITY_DN17621_c0_g1_i1.p1  ORF type:complete len:315 (-),score=74.75 TRINITY_DN17621_c0_g1_i1:59-1003(-)
MCNILSILFVLLLLITSVMSIRRASHAGTWYPASSEEIRSDIDEWMGDTKLKSTNIKAIIGPHAGTRFSGPTAAHAYVNLDPKTTKRIFLLGPSHHVYLGHCVVSKQTEYETPLGNIKVDVEIAEKLTKTEGFDYMTKSTDELEHSLEMHLPFIAYQMGDADYSLVPIMVGHISDSQAEEYGKELSKYLVEEGTVFIISSDFCHWGARFGFQYHEKRHGAIHESISWLDHEGMKKISEKDPKGFAKYLAKYGNTICGRNPIEILLYAIKNSKDIDENYEMNFLFYDQSSAVVSPRDSSVSYAVAILSDKRECME